MSLPIPLKLPALLDLKLPRAIETDPRQKAIETLLKKECKPLWEKSTHTMAYIPFTKPLETCLKILLKRQQIERGLERIDHLLNNERKGLLALQQKQGASPSLRVSRLFLVSNDGSERFYRACEKILLQNKDRVLLLCINESSDRLTQSLMGETNKTLKALLISDREGVSNVLFSLVEGETST